MKKIIMGLVMLSMLFTLSGCAKLVSSDTKNAAVTIENAKHIAGYMMPRKMGKVTTYVTRPATWHTVVSYNGEEYTLVGSSYYNYAKDHIGEKVNAEISVKKYDNDTVVYDVLSIEIP